MKRKPAVAGQFYPSSPSILSRQVKGCIDENVKKEKAIGIVSPHAGLMYSGPVAGSVFSRIEFPHTFILIGPNHTGIGSPVSIMSSGEWQSPCGELKINEDLSWKIMDRCDIVREDPSAHAMEHSLEMQLPFILYFSHDVKIVPITVMADSPDICRLLGEVLADAIKDNGDTVTIVASSDMSHYVSDSTARAKDRKAIEKILALDPEGLYDTVNKNGITMCGIIPVTMMLFAAKKLGAEESVLVKYMTSAEVSGDYDHVVGYAGMIIKQVK
ncbi:MAG: AmmeMemoRadiSam system protein B [Nitrospiraceae bacterium]|nr:MAG: AmmeMemoRadiSam system protein B [Nitrospiraceae bacterium]